MHNHKLLIAYDGTNYSGWQIQPNSLSIQEIIQTNLKTILREEVTLIGSGRTDAGVHAIGQVAHFKTINPIDLAKAHYSLNCLLPSDIRVMEFSVAPAAFHAQRSAIRKTYFYHLHLNKVQDPFKRLYSLHIHQKLNLSAIEEASTFFLGEQDFTSFANEAHTGMAARNPVRTLEKLDIIEESGGVRLEFTANGFLYKMVRNIVGTLLDVGYEKIQPNQIPGIFAAKDRRKASQAAPPHGLFLFKVEYSSS